MPIVRDPELLTQVAVVLVAPREPRNVGAVARAMHNFGVRRLILVQAGELDLTAAQPTAVHATEILGQLEHHDELEPALRPFGLVVGTTRRPGQRRLPLRAPRTLAPAILEAARRTPVAILFGAEDRGLSTAELAHCSLGIRIPAAPAQPSFNLAQAVLLVLYELFLHWLEPAPGAPAPIPAPPAEGATLARLRGLLGELTAGRPEAGALGPVLARLLIRAAPTAQEATLLEPWLASRVAASRPADQPEQP